MATFADVHAISFRPKQYPTQIKEFVYPASAQPKSKQSNTRVLFCLIQYLYHFLWQSCTFDPKPFSQHCEMNCQNIEEDHKCFIYMAEVPNSTGLHRAKVVYHPPAAKLLNVGRIVHFISFFIQRIRNIFLNNAKKTHFY